MSQLKIISGPGAGSTALLVEGEAFTIGRKPREAGSQDTPSLPLEDRRVSRLHCELRSTEGSWTIRDLESANGTFVGGERTGERVLRDGDLIRVGSVVLQFIAELSGTGALPPKEELPVLEGSRRLAEPPRPARPSRPVRALPVTAAAILAGAVVAALALKTLLVDAPGEPGPGAAPPAAKDGPRVASGGKTTRSRIPVPESAPGPAEEKSGVDATKALEVLQAALKEGDFRRALSLVEDSFPATPEELEKLKKVVTEAAERECEKGRRDAEELAGLGDFEAARERLQSLFSRVPESLADRILAPMEDIARAEQARLDSRRQAEGGTGEARLHVARLDFAAAEKALRALPDREETRAAIRRLGEEIRLAREAWEALAAAIDERIQSKVALPLAFEGSAGKGLGGSMPAPAPGADPRWRILRRDGDFLALEPAAGSAREPTFRPILALSDSQLRLFLGLAGAGRSPRSSLREGLGLLLLHRSGPERARAFLMADELPEDRKQRYSGLLAELGDLWIEARAGELSSLFEKTEARRDADGGAWNDLSERAAAFISDARESPAYAARRKQVGGLFLSVRERALELERKESAFAATRVEWKGGRVLLSYEFSSDREIQDFVEPGGGPRRFRREGGSLVLAGECRLLSGEPFEGRIAVKARIPAGGFDPASPNINVALFTSAADSLSPASLRPRSLLAVPPVETGNEPNDFLVLGLGYRMAVAEYGGRAIEELKVAGAPGAVKLPANVVLACAARQPLHSDAREPLWVQPLPGGLQAPLTVEASLDAGELSWKLSGRSLLPARAAGLERIREKKDRVGSVTFFTHKSTVRLDSIEVEANVRREWLQQGVRDEAFQELRALDPAAR